MENELFELCKEVYEKTGWETESWSNHEVNPSWGKTKRFIEKIPDYTSDYLLEKLRETKRIDVIVGINRINEIQCYAKALNLMELHRDIKSFADTPLKALLKLTLALDEVGALK